MDRATLHTLVDEVSTQPADAVAARQVLEDCARLRCWLDARQLAAVSVLDRSPQVVVEQVIADVDRVGVHHAHRVLQRSRLADTAPEVGEALFAGQLTSAHIDELAGAVRKLSPATRSAFLEQTPALVAAAERESVGGFRSHLNREAIRLTSAHDAVTRLQRQRRAGRFRTWIDDDGMSCGQYRLDPEAGATVSAVLHRATRTLFVDSTPPDAPDDPLERSQFLAAHALVHTITQSGIRLAHDRDALAAGEPSMPTWSTPASFIVVVDERTLVEGPHGDSRLSIDGTSDAIPIDTVRRWACDSPLRRLILRDDGVPLDLGRTQRLATGHQRAALRAIYDTCFVPGCDTPFRHCQVHHLTPFAHGGSTNLSDLRPVCSVHHHALHEGGWTVHGTGWTRVIHQPDGTTVTTHPPTRCVQASGAESASKVRTSPTQQPRRLHRPPKLELVPRHNTS
jgi:hypothetical protein